MCRDNAIQEQNNERISTVDESEMFNILFNH